MRAMNSGLLGVHIKGMLVGKSFTISRNQLSFGGGVRKSREESPSQGLPGPKMSKHRKIQKMRNVIKKQKPKNVNMIPNIYYSFYIYRTRILLGMTV